MNLIKYINNFLNLTIYQAQEELYGNRPVFEMPIRLKLNYLNGDDTIVSVWNDQQTQNFSFILNEEVSSIEFDPDKWILRHQQYNPDLPVGIVDFAVEKSINIYPNPFTYEIFFQSDKKLPKNCSIEIFDLNGRIILAEKLQASKFQTITFSNNHTPGYYFYQVLNKRNQIIDSGKLIKH